MDLPELVKNISKELLPSIFQKGGSCPYYKKSLFNINSGTPDGHKCGNFEPVISSEGLACFHCEYYLY